MNETMEIVVVSNGPPRLVRAFIGEYEGAEHLMWVDRVERRVMDPNMKVEVAVMVEVLKVKRRPVNGRRGTRQMIREQLRRFKHAGIVKHDTLQGFIDRCARDIGEERVMALDQRDGFNEAASAAPDWEPSRAEQAIASDLVTEF